MEERNRDADADVLEDDDKVDDEEREEEEEDDHHHHNNIGNARDQTTASHAPLGISSGAITPTLWVFLMTASTLIGRNLLTDSFPYPICFVLLLQLTAYIGVGLIVLCIKSRELLLWDLGRECVSKRRYTWLEFFILALKLTFHIILSTAAIIFGAQAVRRYANFQVLAALPIFTYILDSFLFRLAAILGLARSDQSNTKFGLYRVLFALFCMLLVVYEDYRLDLKGFFFAIASYGLTSSSRLIPRLGPRIDNGAIHTWDCPLYRYLLTDLPPIFITLYAAIRFEDSKSAFWALWAWNGWVLLSCLLPGATLLIVFNCSMNSAFPSSMVLTSGILEDDTPTAKLAVAKTIQASFWIACAGLFLGERNLVAWTQVLSLVVLYVVGVGKQHIALYPPRLMNLIARALRKPQLNITGEPWQLPFFAWSTVCVFVALFSSSCLYWSINVATARDSDDWIGSGNVSLDITYVAPQPYLFDIVIAHSRGDPLQSVSDLISSFANLGFIQPNYPRVKIYTKDSTLPDLANLTGTFTGPLSAVLLDNTGGVAGSFLYHILLSWDFLSTQTLFLSTSSPLPLSILEQRFKDYFVPAMPIHSRRVAEPMTSFLNLGDYETCDCADCKDSLNWSDTFHLVPSMFGAAYRNPQPCKSTLLTLGNDFVVSADRIRGLEREVWQMLLDALVNPSMRNGWAHNKAKLPSTQDGKWVFGEEDSVQAPFLGYTMERLWGVLLQCSSMDIAWRCPNTARGWRRGGLREDCGCLHW